jgi:hypothetical protein
MKILTPEDASIAADTAYRIIDNTDVARAFYDSEIKNKFVLTDDTRFEGIAGASVFRYKSGFGVMATGKDEHQGQALLAIRGTESIPRDLFLTDLNIGLQPSSTNMWVHAGFNKVFESFKKDILRFCDKHNPTTVHCVGHSLGGGLATMAADFLRHENIAQPVLYTFGSPRVGGEQFAQRLTENIGEANIFRVYHKSDIVSMVPLWPFMHVPQPGTECFIESPGIPWITYHAMDKYVGACSGKKDWDLLRRKEPSINWNAEVERWLSSSNPVSFTYHSMVMINKATLFILKKIMHSTLIVAQAYLSNGLTFLDVLAMMLHKGLQMSVEVSGYVIGLMRRILSMLNSTVRVVGDITVQFIRWVFMQLIQSVYRLANMAFDMVYRR